MSLVLVDDLGAIRRLTLNRPDKLNALTRAMVTELSERLATAADDESVRVVVLAGAGRSFCAGYDLDEEAADPPATTLPRDLDRLLEIFDQPQPVIAEVQGHCLAGGCDLMMMCDLAVVSDDAVFGQPEIRFGSTIVAHVMPWLVGARRAKELVYTGFDSLDAATAVDMGLVNRVVTRDRLTEETMALASLLANVDPVVMRLTKLAVNRSWESAGFRESLRQAVDLGVAIEEHASPERVEFERIIREQGLGEAIRWRDGRFQA